MGTVSDQWLMVTIKRSGVRLSMPLPSLCRTMRDSCLSFDIRMPSRHVEYFGLPAQRSHTFIIFVGQISHLKNEEILNCDYKPGISDGEGLWNEDTGLVGRHGNIF